MGAYDFSGRVNTRPLSLYSPRVFTRPLCSHSPWVFTHPLPPHNPRVATYSLRGESMLSTCCLIPLCASRHEALWVGLRWVLPFVCEDPLSSHLVGWLLCGYDSHEIWEYMFCVNCIKLASIRSTVACIVSTFCSMYDSHLACSFTLMMAECRPLWVCSWVCSLAGADVSVICWRVLAIFPGNTASNLWL